MNIGGYDEYVFQESEGNSILRSILEKDKRFKTHFPEMDKDPNFDGYFEICEDEGTRHVPIGRFEVQIKTMSIDYSNANKHGCKSNYKYSCETKAFNAVKKGISLNPVILFLVDVIKHKAFYIYISQEYALGLDIKDQVKKTIYFNESDLLVEQCFYQIVSDIHRKCRKKRFDIQSVTATVPDSLDRKTREQLQDVIDKFNGAFDNELLFIKNQVFPNVWKFGIAYTKNSENFSTIEIYKIFKGEDGALVKSFSTHDDKTFIFNSYFRKSAKDVDAIVTEQTEEIINCYFSEVYLDPKVLPTEVLEEVGFHFLDTIARYCKEYENPVVSCAFNANTVPVTQVNLFWNALVEYAIALWEQVLGEKGFENGATYCSDPFGSMSSGYDLSEKKRLFGEVCKCATGKKPTNYSIQLKGTFEYGFTKKVIDELNRRELSCISRVWKPKNFKECFRELKQTDTIKDWHVETGYTRADMRDNLLKLFKMLPDCYTDTAKLLFGNKYPIIALKQKNYIGFIDDTVFSYSCAIVPDLSFQIETDYKLVEKGKIDSFEVVDKLYPGAIQARCGWLYRAFSGSFPLYQNLSSLIHISICKYMGYQMTPKKVTNEAIFT